MSPECWTMCLERLSTVSSTASGVSLVPARGDNFGQLRMSQLRSVVTCAEMGDMLIGDYNFVRTPISMSSKACDHPCHPSNGSSFGQSGVVTCVPGKSQGSDGQWKLPPGDRQMFFAIISRTFGHLWKFDFMMWVGCCGREQREILSPLLKRK